MENIPDVEGNTRVCVCVSIQKLLRFLSFPVINFHLPGNLTFWVRSFCNFPIFAICIVKWKKKEKGSLDQNDSD